MNENATVEVLACENCKHRHHDWLLPYFKDNPSVERELRCTDDSHAEGIMKKLDFARERGDKNGMFVYRNDFNEMG